MRLLLLANLLTIVTTELEEALCLSLSTDGMDGMEW